MSTHSAISCPRCLAALLAPVQQQRSTVRSRQAEVALSSPLIEMSVPSYRVLVHVTLVYHLLDGNLYSIGHSVSPADEVR